MQNVKCGRRVNGMQGVVFCLPMHEPHVQQPGQSCCRIDVVEPRSENEVNRCGGDWPTENRQSADDKLLNVGETSKRLAYQRLYNAVVSKPACQNFIDGGAGRELHPYSLNCARKTSGMDPQGGKLLNGYMYFATDNDEKLLMRANLATGEVETIGNLKIDGEQEVEGLSIRWTKDGWSMNVLNREESTPGSGEEGVGFYKYLRPTGNALSGEIHADVAGALLADGRFLREASLRRMHNADDAGAPTDGAAFWGEALAATSSTDAVGDAAGFARNSAGFIGGVEGSVGDWLVGLTASYARSDFSVADRASTGSADSYRLGVYGGTQFGDLGLHLGAAFGAHDISTERSVVFPAFSEQLSAQYGARTIEAYGELDYRIDMGAAALSPFAGLAVVSRTTDAFAETGGDTAALSAEQTSDQNAFTTIGVRVTAPLGFGEATGRLHGQIGWQHALGDTETAMQLAIPTGASFDSVGVPIARDALSLEAGLDFALNDAASLTASYSGQLAEGTQNHGVKLGFGLKF